MTANQLRSTMLLFIFFFNDTATTEIYTLSLHDALPISRGALLDPVAAGARGPRPGGRRVPRRAAEDQAARAEGQVDGLRRSEEHTSELQSQSNLVCRLLLEKKK